MKIVLQKAGIAGLIVLSGLLPNTLWCQTWQDLGDVSGNAAYRHDDVWFVSSAKGYTVYYNASEAVKRGTIFKTTDGGASWNVSKKKATAPISDVLLLWMRKGYCRQSGQRLF